MVEMSEFFDYNPNRGTWYEVDEDAQSGGMFIHTKQDVQPIIDHATAIRNSGLAEKKARKTDFLHYATIPAHVELEIKEKYGISIYDKHETKKLLQIINRDYPYLKTTEWTHNI
jgi:hypothetical protein